MHTRYFLLLLPLAACTIVLPEKVDIDGNVGDIGGGDDDDDTTGSTSTDESWTSTSTSTSTDTTGGGDKVDLGGAWVGLVDCPTYGEFSALALDLDSSGDGYGAIQFAAYVSSSTTATEYYLIDFAVAVSPSHADASDNVVDITIDTSDCNLIDPYSAPVYCETFEDVVWHVGNERIEGTLANYLQIGEDCTFQLDPY